MGLDPIDFKWIADEQNEMDKRRHFGVTAQRLFSLLEENVDDPTEYKVVDTNDGKMYTLAYSELIPLLIKTVQEQEERIDALERSN